MAREVERKFLLGEAPGWLSSYPGRQINQGYLAIADGVEVRIRRVDAERVLTVKRGHGEVREEVEIALAPDQFDELWPLTASRRLAKCRYLVPVGDLCAEVDVYGGALDGLVTAEIEFESERTSRRCDVPGWLGTEITDDGRYANQTLAVAGLPKHE